MERSKKQIIKEWVTDITAITLITMLMLVFVPYFAYAQEDIEVNGSDNLVLEIVDDGSETLSEDAVPLAAGPADANYISHAVLAGVLLALCLIYCIYFYRHQKKIFTLRQEVADAEKRVMRS